MSVMEEERGEHKDDNQDQGENGRQGHHRPQPRLRPGGAREVRLRHIRGPGVTHQEVIKIT